MKKIIIIVAVTLLICAFIIFYDPNSKYLAVYKDSFTIENKDSEDEYDWIYEIDSTVIKLEKTGRSDDNNLVEYWKFVPVRDGIASIVFYYKKNDSDDYQYKNTYKFKVDGEKIMWMSGEAYGLYDFPNPF